MARAPKTPAQIRVECELRSLYPGKTPEEALRMDIEKLNRKNRDGYVMMCAVCFAAVLLVIAGIFSLFSGGS